MRCPLLVGILLVASSTIAAGPYVELEIDAPGPMGPLKGSFIAPKGPQEPVVLIIPGSGPTDRDGNSPAGISASTYKRIADGLAAHGIGSLRFDKRGMFGSGKAIDDANSVTMDDYARDVHNWVNVLLGKTGNHCVWVLGHSEGGLVALVAAQQPRKMCGLILLSTPGRPMGAILREQLQGNPANAPILDQALSALSSLEGGHRVDAARLNPALLPLFRSEVQGFLINVFSYDPAKLIAAVSVPVLILQGTRDMQVGVDDANRLKRAAPNARLTVVERANHVWKAVTTDDYGANIATYSDAQLPLAPGLIEELTRFIDQSHAASQ